jgi:hypothetical protein
MGGIPVDEVVVHRGAKAVGAALRIEPKEVLAEAFGLAKPELADRTGSFVMLVMHGFAHSGYQQRYTFFPFIFNVLPLCSICMTAAGKDRGKQHP